MRYLALFALASLLQAADVCVPQKFPGAYAFLLAGTTTISGSPQPSVSLGRLTFDDSGKISGASSVKLAGFLLGNPVTGTYENKQDCTVTWQLQDDSGAYQHFSGKYTPDAIRVQFRQTDPGAPPSGTMIRTPDSCSSTDLQRKYSFNVSGGATPMNPGESVHDVSGKGVIDTAREGAFQVDSDCTVHFTLTLPSPDGRLQFRGFLVNSGKEILSFQTDPGAMVSARLTAVN